MWWAGRQELPAAEEPQAGVVEAGPRGAADPAWLAGLLAHLPKDWVCQRDDSAFSALETSPPAPEGAYDFLFGRRPTEDQARLVGRFIASYQEALREYQGDGPDVEPSADLLVDGDPGSTRCPRTKAA